MRIEDRRINRDPRSSISILDPQSSVTQTGWELWSRFWSPPVPRGWCGGDKSCRTWNCV